MIIDKEIEEDYNNLWKDIIENEDGSINIEQVKKELYDYSKLMDRTMKLYDELTLGYISKPNTNIIHIIDKVNERIRESYDDGYNDAYELYGDIECIKALSQIEGYIMSYEGMKRTGALYDNIDLIIRHLTRINKELEL